MAPKPSATDTGAKSPLSFSVVGTSDIPKVVRAGRVSRYAPLYTRLSTLKPNEVITLPITKYSQVQAFRGRVENMGFTVAVRTTKANGKKQLVAYIQHAPKSESTSASKS